MLTAGRTTLSAWLLAASLSLVVTGARAQEEVAALEPEYGTFAIQFENVELPTFIKFISKVTGRKFVFSDRITGPVTVVSPMAVTAEEAYVMFESVLAVRGLTMIDDGVATRIVPLKDARTAGGSVISTGRGAAGFATQLLPLEHVDASEIASVLEPMISREGALVAYPATNTLVVSDTAANLSRVANVVAALDIKSHQENAEVISLVHADAPSLAEKIGEILTRTDRQQRGGKDRGAQSVESFRIVPDERTNSLIVVADPTMLRKIRDLAARLDTPLEPGGERLNVYYARYADAEALVEVVGSMVAADRRRGQRAPQGQAQAQQATAALPSDVTISADGATNAVIVNASAQDYKTIRGLLESIDIQRPQVFVEAIIAEVSIDHTRALGLEFQAGGDIGDGTGLGRTNFGSLATAFANPAALGGLILAATSDRTIELPDGTEIPAQAALFQALAADNDVDVLSAPTLLTLDNQEARIVVGENVPFVTSRGVDISAVENVFTTVERRDVGIKLTITPQVAEGDVVILRVEEEISALVENVILDEAEVGPTTTIRSARTTVSVQDGHTAVIGGLISNATRRGSSKVPILGDIPILGRLFRSDEDQNRKVNLIVFLTPHVIRNTSDLARVSETRRQHFTAGTPAIEVPFPDIDQPPVIPGEPDERPGGAAPPVLDDAEPAPAPHGS